LVYNENGYNRIIADNYVSVFVRYDYSA